MMMSSLSTEFMAGFIFLENEALSKFSDSWIKRIDGLQESNDIMHLVSAFIRDASVTVGT